MTRIDEIATVAMTVLAFAVSYGAVAAAFYAML
jgi:hypothetical protein